MSAAVEKPRPCPAGKSELRGDKLVWSSCTLARGHEGDHDWTDAQEVNRIFVPTPTLIDVAKEARVACTLSEKTVHILKRITDEIAVIGVADASFHQVGQACARAASLLDVELNAHVLAAIKAHSDAQAASLRVANHEYRKLAQTFVALADVAVDAAKAIERSGRALVDEGFLRLAELRHQAAVR